MTGGVTGPQGNFTVNVDGQDVIVTPEDLYMQEAVDQLLENPEMREQFESALGRPLNENDIQFILELMAHPELASKPEYEQFKELIGALEEMVIQELGFDENWKPDSAKFKLSVYRRYISAGKFNEVVNKLAEGPPPLSEGEKNALLSLYANPQNAGDVDPDQLNQLLGALHAEYEGPEGAVLEAPIDLSQLTPEQVEAYMAELAELTGYEGDMSALLNTASVMRAFGIELSQANIDNLQNDIPLLTSDEFSTQINNVTINALEKSGGNPWFGPNMLTALFENILELVEVMKDIKIMETQLLVNMISATLQMAHEIADLTIASSKMEAEMLRNEAKKMVAQAVVSFVFAGLMFGAGAKLRKSPEKLMAAAGSLQALNDATNKAIEAAVTFIKANITIEKGYTDAVKEFLQQVIGILQQEMSKASESYKQVVEQMSQLIQQFNKWVDEHYQAHNFSRG